MVAHVRPCAEPTHTPGADLAFQRTGHYRRGAGGIGHAGAVADNVGGDALVGLCRALPCWHIAAEHDHHRRIWLYLMSDKWLCSLSCAGSAFEDRGRVLIDGQ